MNSKARDLEREVFGGSESELSSDEDDYDINQQQQQQQQQQRPHPPSLPTRPAPAQPATSSGESDDDASEEYVQPKQSAPSASGGAGVIGKARKKKVKKKRVGEAVGEAEREGKASKKRKRKAPVEVDLSELPPEQANKIRLDMKIDEILKSKKSTRPRKKKAGDEVLDSFADDEVARLREAMNNAADEDVRANQEKLPALAKLKMIGEVGDVLRKSSLAQSIIDNNLLDGVRRWLEPLPDRSLPALSIQRTLFPLIKKMEFIDSSVLKESGLGRIVLFYTKCKRVTPDVSRIATELVETWTRPIVKRSASYRDRVVPTAGLSQGGSVVSTGGAARPNDLKLTLSSILARAKVEESKAGGRKNPNAVRIPQRELGTYVVAPVDGLLGRNNASVEKDVERRRRNAERLRGLVRRLG